MKPTLLPLALTLACLQTAAQPYAAAIASVQGEWWIGAMTALGRDMPIEASATWRDLARTAHGNQAASLLLSNKGRYVWSDYPFAFRASADTLYIRSDYEQIQAVTALEQTLRGAYLAAMNIHFPPSGTMPPEVFFAQPQYNTWIELMYNQNQADIQAYADSVISNGFPVGVFMIDDNWQRYYGNLDFKNNRFPDPRAMTDRLHEQGFKVMLWVVPYISPDSPEFRDLQQKGYLLRNHNQGAAIIHWWNGYSAAYDMTNPQACDYFAAQLKDNQDKYGIDGYKFDGGDIDNIPSNSRYYDSSAQGPFVYTKRWAEFGLRFPYNEYRASYNNGGLPLVQRLGDKDYSWKALSLIIPDITTAGLLGYWYACPDMIGGGLNSAFVGIKSDQFDQALIVRSCQLHAMMPMMQFSVAPWRILNAKNLAICRRYALLHQSLAPYIIECAKRASVSGEPIVQSMEYAYPNEGFSRCKDQYMLGSKYLVAPILTQSNTRVVKLPAGKWKDDQGRVHRGGTTITIDAPLERLPYFERLLQ